MTPESVIRQAAADGVRLVLSPPDKIKLIGGEKVVDRWLPVIREHKPEIIEALREAANSPLPDGLFDTFEFAPPSDPTDDEASHERVAIMMEDNGWDEATALQEARWDVDRQTCWQRFLRNAQRILNAPETLREGLLALYQEEATARYGDRTGADMAASLRNWVAKSGLH